MKTTLLMTVLLLAGCATSPRLAVAPEAPTAPVQWQFAPEQGAALAWTGADDPALDALIQLAEQRNRDLAQAALRLQAAGLQQAQGQLRVTPSVGGTAGASKPLDPSLTTEISHSSGLNLGVAWEADLWGRIEAQQRLDAAQQRAAETDVRAARLSLRSRVAELYWQIASARQQAQLATRQAGIARELLEATRLRVREGKLAPIEIDRAAATLQLIEVRLVDLQADSRQARLQLALLLDQPPPGPQLLEARLPDDFPEVALPDAAPAQVLARRPDVQRSRAQVDTALARLQVSEAARYPTLSLSGSLGSGGASLSDLLKNPIASLNSNLIVPLIDWRRLDLQRDGARTELELAALQLRETLARALTEIESAWLDDERLRQQLAANATRLLEAREAERLAALRFDVGVLARTELLQAQTARLETEQGRLQLQLRAWQQRAQLTKALAWAAAGSAPAAQR
jgi:NodT family efflux transporter outer membrane factor (OMF) lipoprotein